jgi:hypothetical protein
MASVRLGKDLRKTIFRAAEKAYDSTATEATVDNDILEQIWKGIVDHPTHQAYSKYVADHKRSTENFLHQHIKKTESNRLCVSGYGGEKEDHRIYLDLPTTRTSYIDYGYNAHHVELSDLHLSSVQYLAIKDKIKAVSEKRVQAATDKQHYLRQIKALLESCNTLKQLLDTQPSMREFVDDELVRDMHKKVTRESQARERREIAQVDSDLINQVVLTSKLVA